MIKKRSALLLAFAALVAGGVIGSGISSYCSGQVQQFVIVAASLKEVSDSYKPLKLLQDGDTTNATKVLQTQLTKSLQRLGPGVAGVQPARHPHQRLRGQRQGIEVSRVRFDRDSIAA